MRDTFASTEARSLRLVYLATDPLTAFRLMEGQLAAMRLRGFDVTIITSPGELLERAATREGVQALGIPMRRAISPAADLVALARLVQAFRRIRPDIVNAGTPKAGLLGVIAGRLARVPTVIYWVRGLRFEGTTGVARLLLVGSEHLAGWLAHRVICNSESLRGRFVELACAPRDKTFVPAHGTSNGVEPERFQRSPERVRWASAERRRLGIPDTALVVGFVGRFVRDKGIVELLDAFDRARSRVPDLWLLLVGDHDDSDPLPGAVAERLTADPRIRTTGFVDEPAAYYAVMNVFAFPSRREGFPNAPLEAAAAELPVVAFKATGTVDAVVDGETGQLIAPGDIAQFARALVDYARDPRLREAHGSAGRARVERWFRREIVWDALAAEYARLLGETRAPSP
jgi:glycosyltransferase involved in cell wall biosynthesis